MELYFLWAGIALCSFSLWVIARHDWLRLTRPMHRVLAEVKGHRQGTDCDGTSYAAVFRFQADGAVHEVVDAVFSPAPMLDIGTMRELSHPEGRADLARPPRPLLWCGIYALLIGLDGMLIAKLCGLLD